MRKLLLLTGCVAMAFTCLADYASAQAPFQPTAEFAILKKDAGTWEAKGKMWMPGNPNAMEFGGVESNKMIGELWCVTDFQGDFGGMKFHGHGRLGFNPDSKKYEGQWFDSMSPYVTKLVGTYDKEKDTMTVVTTGVGPDGSEMKGKQTIVYKGKDSRVMTMFGPDPAGGDKLIKTMEITYTRKK